MNNLQEYIVEKFKISKDIKNIKTSDNYVDNIIEMIEPTIDEEKIREILTTWIDDYNKKLYMYVNQVDYKYRWKECFKKYDNIWISGVDSGQLNAAVKYASQSDVYRNKRSNIRKISLSQYNLAIDIGGWDTIVFEKSHI